jgi:CDP-diacylglycerol--glycerol-3-phosphate 3-phosphatidyltransferase
MRMRRDLLTLPNLLSFLRILLVVPFVAVLLSGVPGARLWAVLILAVAALTDRLDGALARRWHQESEWGRILDPLADKIGITAAVVTLWAIGNLPGWFILVLVLRDSLIFAGGIILKVRRGIVLPSITAGKWAVGVFSVTVLGALLQWGSPVMETLLSASVVMALLSFSLYVQRFLLTAGSAQR